MRIAIVNDMKVAIEALKKTVAAIPGACVAWIAYNGLEAVQKNAEDTPDLILMDLIMPVMNGVEATKIIMRDSPCPILVVTALVEGNISLVFEAMGYGALDAVDTPNLSRENGMNTILKKIQIISRIITHKQEVETRANSLKKNPPARQETPHLIIIGASTGGPQTLARILEKTPASIAAAVIIIQHVDEKFAEGLAKWLQMKCILPVLIAREGASPETNKVYLAGKNKHLLINREHCFHYTAKPENNPYKPSVNVMFESAAINWPNQGRAALLTGMGDDGANGLLTLSKSGWQTFAQDKETCVVYGMPKIALEIGAVREGLPVDIIAKRLFQQWR